MTNSEIEDALNRHMGWFKAQVSWSNEETEEVYCSMKLGWTHKNEAFSRMHSIGGPDYLHSTQDTRILLSTLTDEQREAYATKHLPHEAATSDPTKLLFATPYMQACAALRAIGKWKE